MSHVPSLSTHTLVTPSCTFKLYAGTLARPTLRYVQGLALTWIERSTAGFIRKDSNAALAVFWWEGSLLCRMDCKGDASGRARSRHVLALGDVDDFGLLTLEAQSWKRHVLRRSPPSITSYLAELHS